MYAIGNVAERATSTALRPAAGTANSAVTSGVGQIPQQAIPNSSHAAGLRAWGWPVRQVGTSLVLETTSGFCGVEMRQSQAEAVLRRLQEVGADGPVVRTLRPDPWLVFLAEADSFVEPEFFARHRARLVQGASPIPLPPTVTDLGRTSWVVPPRPSRRWLPGLSTLVWAMTPASIR